MLDVVDYERIRRMVQIEGKTQRQASEESGHSRNMVAKALAHSSPPGYRRQKPPPRPALDSFLSLIDAWVEADRQQPRKQRHTGTRIYERLRDEYGFTGSVSAVRRYLAQRKKTQGEVFFPLQFEVGEEGQVDWGEAWCLLNGVEQQKPKPIITHHAAIRHLLHQQLGKVTHPVFLLCHILNPENMKTNQCRPYLILTVKTEGLLKTIHKDHLIRQATLDIGCYQILQFLLYPFTLLNLPLKLFGACPNRLFQIVVHLLQRIVKHTNL